jgi:hypothetical protein
MGTMITKEVTIYLEREPSTLGGEYVEIEVKGSASFYSAPATYLDPAEEEEEIVIESSSLPLTAEEEKEAEDALRERALFEIEYPTSDDIGCFKFHELRDEGKI